METRNPRDAGPGLVFSDFLRECWAYRLVPNDDETSSVFVDYGRLRIHVASTLQEFFDMYLECPRLVLEDAPAE